MTAAAWHRAPEIARVDAASNQRTVLLNLQRPTQPPVVLEGAARRVFDLVDGRRDTAAIVALLTSDHPDTPTVDAEVRTCLEALAAIGLVSG